MVKYKRAKLLDVQVLTTLTFPLFAFLNFNDKGEDKISGPIKDTWM